MRELPVGSKHRVCDVLRKITSYEASPSGENAGGDRARHLYPLTKNTSFFYHGPSRALSVDGVNRELIPFLVVDHDRGSPARLVRAAR